MTNEEMVAELEKLKSENAALKSQVHEKGDTRITLKVGEKGGLCVYGLGRFPINLYASGAVKLFTNEQVRLVNEFVIANADKMTFGKPGETDPAKVRESVLALARKNLGQE